MIAFRNKIQNIRCRFLMVIAIIFLSQSMYAGNLNAYLYMAQFRTPSSGPYVETYLNIEGRTVTFKKNDKGEYQSKLQVLYLFKQNGEIKAFEKYVLESPIIKDSIVYYPNYTDVQRIFIKNGIYNFELQVRDLYDSTNVFTYSNIVTINMEESRQFSDIEFVQTYKKTQGESVISKNGIDMTPYVSTYFSEKMDSLTFYAELYNDAKVEDFLFQYYIEESKSKKKQNSFSRSKKIRLKEVYPIFSSFSIKELRTGNYNLVLMLRDKQNKEVCVKRIFFQRYNNQIKEEPDTIRITSNGIPEIVGITDVRIMQDYIKSTFPILDQRELHKANNVLKSKDIDLMKAFFNSYWNSVSSDPEQEWTIYNKNVQMVNRSYGSQIKRGYESDRGITYLKYGPPNDINKSEHEPSTYPYEIWHYFEVKGETNRRFIFYNPELSGDDYVLLHSDVTGEKYNPYWQKELTSRNSTRPNNFDQMRGEDQYGNRSNDLYGR